MFSILHGNTPLNDNSAQNPDTHDSFQKNIGIAFAAGGRYDEVRMCVASPAGFKGGPAFEFAAITYEKRINTSAGIGFYIPLARPILFASAFRMLQFLPEAVLSLYGSSSRRARPVTDIAIGASLHCGPDYLSGNRPGETLGKWFFAAGPRMSVFTGFVLPLNNKAFLKAGIRPYAEFLYSSYLQGFVFGGEAAVQTHFAAK